MSSFAGDAFIWILAASGAAAVVMFFERLVELRRAQIDWHDFLVGVTNVLETGNEAEALAICEDTPVPVANVAAAAIRMRKASLPTLKEAVSAAQRAETGRLDRRTAALGVICQCAPLVGLLGTIAGFARTVMLLGEGPVIERRELLAGAVSSMTVAGAGLAVAILAAIMLAILRARFARISSDLDAAAAEIAGYAESGRWKAR